MPGFGPISRRELIRGLRAAFTGPIPARTHEVMRRGTALPIMIPDPHRGDISVGLLSRILRQAGISRREWERL